MNQPFSTQHLTSIVGATLAVALVTLTNSVTLVTLTDKCRRPGKASKRRQKILFQNETYLKQIAANAPSGARSLLFRAGYMTNFDRDIIKVAELDDLDDGE